MKNLFCFALFPLVTIFSSSLYSKELKIGYFSAPPFTVITQNKMSPKGVVVEMWEEIAKEMGHSIDWKQMTIARILQELDDEKLDGSSLFVPSPDRKKTYHFPINTWDYVQPGIAVRNDSPLKKLKELKDLKGLNIGSSTKSVITPWFKINKVKFKNISGTNFVERLLKQLQIGRIDAVYWPSISGMKILIARIKGQYKVRYLRSPMGPYPIKAMFPNTINGQLLAKKFDEAFLIVQKRFDYLKVKKKYELNP